VAGCELEVAPEVHAELGDHVIAAIRPLLLDGDVPCEACADKIDSPGAAIAVSVDVEMPPPSGGGPIRRVYFTHPACAPSRRCHAGNLSLQGRLHGREHAHPGERVRSLLGLRGCHPRAVMVWEDLGVVVVRHGYQRQRQHIELTDGRIARMLALGMTLVDHPARLLQPKVVPGLQLDLELAGGGLAGHLTVRAGSLVILRIALGVQSAWWVNTVVRERRCLAITGTALRLGTSDLEARMARVSQAGQLVAGVLDVQLVPWRSWRNDAG